MSTNSGGHHVNAQGMKGYFMLAVSTLSSVVELLIPRSQVLQQDITQDAITPALNIFGILTETNCQNHQWRRFMHAEQEN